MCKKQDKLFIKIGLVCESENRPHSHLAAPEAVAGRGVVDGEIVAVVKAGGLYVGNAFGQQLVLMLQFHHFHRGLHASNWC